MQNSTDMQYIGGAMTPEGTAVFKVMAKNADEAKSMIEYHLIDEGIEKPNVFINVIPKAIK